MAALIAPKYLNDYLAGYHDTHPATDYYDVWLLWYLEYDFGLLEANGDLEQILFDLSYPT